MRGPERTSQERYAVLDGVRGLAVLLVLFSHISNECRRCTGEMTFTGVGEFGVWLFFVLSAFLLSLYFFQKPERMLRPIEWANYAFRRFTRIYPLYSVAILTWSLTHDRVYASMLRPLLLQEPSYWAVFVEFRFYFLLPTAVVALAFLGRRSPRLPPLALAGAIAMHYRFFPDGSTVLGYNPWGHVSILFSEYLIVFLIGVFTAWLYVHTSALRLRLQTSRLANASLLVMLTTLFVAMPGVFNLISEHFSSLPHLDPDYYHLQWVPWSVFFAAMIYLTMSTKGIVARLFQCPPMRLFGFISYSMYLFMDYMIAPMQSFDTVSYFIFSAGAATLLSWCLFVSVERPISRLSLLRFRRSAPGAATES